MECLVSPHHARPLSACLSRGDPPHCQSRRGQKRGARTGLIPLSVPEVRRLLLTLDEPPERVPSRLAWSTFRRKHQAVAQRCHAARRAQRQPIAITSPTMQVLSTPVLALTDERWTRIALLLPPQGSRRGRPPN